MNTPRDTVARVAAEMRGCCGATPKTLDVWAADLAAALADVCEWQTDDRGVTYITTCEHMMTDDPQEFCPHCLKPVRVTT